MQRIIISCAAGTDLHQLGRDLQGAGATSVAPIDSLPDTLLALVEDDGVAAFLDHANGLPAVRHAERDSLRFST